MRVTIEMKVTKPWNGCENWEWAAEQIVKRRGVIAGGASFLAAPDLPTPPSDTEASRPTQACGRRLSLLT